MFYISAILNLDSRRYAVFLSGLFHMKNKSMVKILKFDSANKDIPRFSCINSHFVF